MTELYKKHRPKTLARVVGNESTVKTLENMLRRKTLPHTLLFHGPSGCGKTTLARILRTELGCHDLDFKELDCSQFRGIDTIRDITASMAYAPSGGPCRIWILDEVHQLNGYGQNAALKILEDTPTHCYFFLCTTDPQKLLPTILNRATKIPVEKLSVGLIERLIKRVAKREKIKLSADVLGDLADAAHGSARQSLVLLDQVANLDDDERADAIKQKVEEETESIHLCRLLIKKAPWSKVASCLKTLKTDVEKTRWGVLTYARKVLLDGKSPQAYLVIRAFEEHFYNSKEAGLCRASYEAIFGDAD